MFPYLFQKLNMSRENKLWFAFINGCTQHVLTTYLIYRRFPSLADLDIEDLRLWFQGNYHRLGWDTDRRYHKKMFVECILDYRKNLAGRSQTEFFDNLTSEPFNIVWDEVRNNFLSFGRLSTFSYLEYLRIMGLPINCDTLLLEDLSGSKSHRNGLVMVLGRDDFDWHASNPEFKGYSKEQIGWLIEEGQTLLDEAHIRFRGCFFEEEVNYFTLESTLCCYKSWHRPNRRYPNVYNDMFCNRIRDTEKAWPEEDFTLFWDARCRYLPVNLRLEDNPRDPGIHPRKQNWYRETGQVILMDSMWDCFKNDFYISLKEASV